MTPPKALFISSSSMKSYLKKVFLFVLPILVPFSLPIIFQLFLFNKSGESHLFSIEPLEKGSIVGYKYDNLKDINYKYQIVTRKRFEIVGIGSSRVLQFREKFFNRSFYAWNIINYSSDYLNIFHLLKANNTLPSFFLLQLDERTFNKDFDQADPTLKFLSKPNLVSFDPDLNIAIIKDYIALNRRSEFKGYSLKGLAAQYYFSGYRHDGSYQYGKLIYNMNFDYENFDSTFVAQRALIDDDNKFFNINYSSTALSNLNLFLEECSKSGVKVICFFQPYPNSIVKTLKEKGYYNTIIETRSKVEGLFQKNSHLYINTNSLPAGDDLSMDGIHPTEKSNLNLLMKIPPQTLYRTILNEKVLSKNVASNICLDSEELRAVKTFFQSTGNYFPAQN